MRALVARYGSPLTDEFFPSFARPPSKNAMQKAESTLSAPR
jgi:hypothetical protein